MSFLSLAENPTHLGILKLPFMSHKYLSISINASGIFLFPNCLRPLNLNADRHGDEMAA